VTVSLPQTLAYIAGTMSLITDTRTLADFCQRLRQAPYVTVDTEFLRDTTYWPKLCLVQLGGPEAEDVAAVDALAQGLDLQPLFELLRDETVLKVFHSGRQDMEIFHNLMEGALPKPIFDTQVAAMVCGFGEQVGYDTLAKKLVGAHIDKSSRFSDWSKRPLTERMLDYALSDVTHLRGIYDQLKQQLERTGRARWLDEEMAILTDPNTYRTDPELAWQRLKTRSSDRKYLAVLREVAAWREREAQRRNVPRNRVIRDEQIQDIAAHAPRDEAALARTRGLGADFARGRLGAGVLEAVETALALPKDQRPEPPQKPDLPPGLGPLVELLKVLLKTKCEDHGVAQKLVATSQDLEQIAADDDADVAALSGWRREIFGADALKLKHGKLALAAEGRQVKLIEV
jgi:ribonuclease D